MAYEVGLQLLTPSQLEFARNGAEVWLREALSWSGIRSAFLLPATLVIALIGWIVVSRKGWRPELRCLPVMMAECWLLGAGLIAVGEVVELGLNRIDPAMLAPMNAALGPQTPGRERALHELDSPFADRRLGPIRPSIRRMALMIPCDPPSDPPGSDPTLETSGESVENSASSTPIENSATTGESKPTTESNDPSTSSTGSAAPVENADTASSADPPSDQSSQSPGTLSTPVLLGYLGAGVYEETVFRLALLPLLYAMFRLALFSSGASWLASLFVSSFLFSIAHHVGTPGEPFLWAVFLFRCVAGVYFGLVFIARGFGVAVGTHAAYDVLVGGLGWHLAIQGSSPVAMN